MTEVQEHFEAYYSNIPEGPAPRSRLQSTKERLLPLFIFSILKALINNTHLIFQTVIYAVNLFAWKFDNSSNIGVQFGMALGLTICNFLLHLTRLRNKLSFNFHMNAFVVSIFWQLFISLFATDYTSENEKMTPTYDNQYFYNWIHIFIQCNHLSKVQARVIATDLANQPMWKFHFENLKKAFLRTNHLTYQILEIWLLQKYPVHVDWPFQEGCLAECERGGRLLFLIVLLVFTFLLHFIRLLFQHRILRGWQIGLYWIAACASVTGDVYMTFYLVDYSEDKITEKTKPEVWHGQLLAMINHILSLLSPAWKRRDVYEDETTEVIRAIEMVQHKKKNKNASKKERDISRNSFY